VPARLDSPEEVARAHHAARLLGMPHALLIANPVEDGLPFETVQGWVETAGREARKAGVHGKSLTPFLLRRLAELSGGESVRVNLALLYANARLGARIAAASALGAGAWA
jgi:pseudouridine-5'-phosphate glycosidase